MSVPNSVPERGIKCGYYYHTAAPAWVLVPAWGRDICVLLACMLRAVMCMSQFIGSIKYINVNLELLSNKSNTFTRF